MSTAALLAWLRARDRDLVALRRAARAAIVMPSLFAIGVQVIGNPTWPRSRPSARSPAAAGRLQRPDARAAASAGDARRWPAPGSSAWARWRHGRRAGRGGDGCRRLRVLFAGVVSSVLAGARPLCCWRSSSRSPSRAGVLDPDRLLGWGMAAVVALVAIACCGRPRERIPLRGPRSRPAGRSRPGSAPTSAYRLGGETAPTAEQHAAVESQSTPRCCAAAGLPRDAVPADRAEHSRPHARPAGRRAQLVERHRPGHAAAGSGALGCATWTCRWPPRFARTRRRSARGAGR